MLYPQFCAIYIFIQSIQMHYTCTDAAKIIIGVRYSKFAYVGITRKHNGRIEL